MKKKTKEQSTEGAETSNAKGISPEHTPTPWIPFSEYEMKEIDEALKAATCPTPFREQVARAVNAYSMWSAGMKYEAKTYDQLTKEIERLRSTNAALLDEAKEARTLLNHLVKFLKFQRPGKEFYPNREAGEACINRLETLIAKAKQAESEGK